MSSTLPLPRTSTVSGAIAGHQRGAPPLPFPATRGYERTQSSLRNDQEGPSALTDQVGRNAVAATKRWLVDPSEPESTVTAQPAAGPTVDANRVSTAVRRAERACLIVSAACAIAGSRERVSLAGSCTDSSTEKTCTSAPMRPARNAAARDAGSAFDSPCVATRRGRS